MSNSPETDLQGRVAIVTGGGRGTGRAFAQALAEVGMAVAVTARSEDQLQETVSLIEREGGRAISVPADISDRASVERVVDLTESQLGPVYLLVNNAGVTGPVMPDWESDPDDWWHTIEVNLRGPYLITRAVLPGMVSRKRGRIVNIVSAVTYHSFPYFAPYTVSKAALTYYTQLLAGQVKEHGISIFAYHPGGPRTEMSRHLAEAPEVHESVGNVFRGLRDNDRYTPMDVAVKGFMFLASGKADALTGRFFNETDEQDDLLSRADEILRDDLYILTRRS